MPSCKRRIAQLGRENAKVAKKNMTMFRFFQPKDAVARTEDAAVPSPVSQPEEPVPSSSSSRTQPSLVDRSASVKQKEKRKDSGHKVGFCSEWQTRRPWLQCVTETGEDGDMTEVMYCGLCKTHKSWGFNGSKVWVEKGCRTLRLDKVKEHERSSQHKNSLSQSLQVTLENMNERINTEAEEAIHDALKVLFFIISKNLPLDMFSAMIDLCISVGSPSLEKLRLAKNARYDSWDIVQDLLSTLSADVRTEMNRDLQNSDSYSVMADEVTDLTTTKHLALCTKYVGSDGHIKTSFLSDSELKVADAESLVNSISSELAKNSLHLQKMTGFASDGAAVFTGRKNGVAKRLKDINPKLVTTHCKDHRLALACRDSFGEEPVFKKLDSTLDSLYTNYNYSSNKKASLREVQKAFDETPLTIKQAKHHRWLSHEKSVNSVVRSYKSLITDLESTSISSDPQGHGILKELKKPDTLRILLLLADALPHVTGLSLFFQQRDCHLGDVSGKVDKTLRNLKRLQTVDGPWLNKATNIMEEAGLNNESSSTGFQRVQISFLDRLISNIESRFTDPDVMDHLAVLDLSRNEEFPCLHGQLEMENLAAHYNLDPEDLLVQWQDFIDLVKDMPAEMRTMPHLLQLFYSPENERKGLKGQYPLISQLLSAACVMPLSTAEVERVFSQLKLVKTSHRCSLRTETIDQLLNIKLNCSKELFNKLKTSVVRKFFNKERRLTSVCSTHL